MQIRWLGVAGLELDHGGFRLLIDPFLSRPPVWYLLGGRPKTDAARVDAHLPACQAILVSHAHYDHLMDVPYLALRDGATVFGSENVMRILAAYQIGADQMVRLESGWRRSIGPYMVQAIVGRHGRVFGIVPYRGKVRERLQAPLSLSEFRIDRMFSFFVEAAGRRILFWNRPEAEGAVEADALILLPQVLDARLDALLATVRPKRIIPIHWDNFFQPPDRSAYEFLMPGGWPFRRQSVQAFAKRVAANSSSIEVLKPIIFEPIIL
jgi:hypothetical protein